jgi:aminotransferase
VKKTASKRARAAVKPPSLSRRTRPFRESVIREMTRIGAEVGGVNLAQGLPDFDPPRALLEALPGILADPKNHQYSYTWGSPELRQAVAEKCARFNGFRADPQTEVTITCGVSEALVDAVLALTEPGDEVVILEPGTKLCPGLRARRSSSALRACRTISVWTRTRSRAFAAGPA